MRAFTHPCLLLAFLASAAPLSAQCRLCAQPSVAGTDQPATTGDVDLQIETSLNFDRLILSGSGPGAVTIRPDGSSGVEGSVLEAGPRAMVGTVLVHGIANRPLRVEMPRRIELFSVNGARITLDDIKSDLPAVPRLDAAGNLSFRFGGRLILSGDSDGPYRGELQITVEYQ
jgi:hypothetical protein